MDDILATWYEELTHWERLGKIEGRRRRDNRGWDGWMTSLTVKCTDMNLSKLWEIVEDRGTGLLQSMGSQRVRHNLGTEQQRKDCSWNLASKLLSSSSSGNSRIEQKDPIKPGMVRTPASPLMNHRLVQLEGSPEIRYKQFWASFFSPIICNYYLPCPSPFT